MEPLDGGVPDRRVPARLWRSGARLAAALPDDFATALEIFRDAATYWTERGRIFMVLLDNPVPGLAVPPLRQ